MHLPNSKSPHCLMYGGRVACRVRERARERGMEELLSMVMIMHVIGLVEGRENRATEDRDSKA